jgi:hypothetical protein
VLPSRAVICARNDTLRRTQLTAIRAWLVGEDWHEAWPGAEFGKAIVGQAVDGALAEIPPTRTDLLPRNKAT